jgi:hypothetical protein
VSLASGEAGVRLEIRLVIRPSDQGWRQKVLVGGQKKRLTTDGGARLVFRSVPDAPVVVSLVSGPSGAEGGMRERRSEARRTE